MTDLDHERGAKLRGSSVTDLSFEEQNLIDFLAWGQFYTMNEEEFRDPKQPWNRSDATL